MKKTVLLFLCLFCTKNVVSQSLMQTFGASGFSDYYKSKSTVSSGIIYSIRYNMVEKDKLSVSVGVPFSLGGSSEEGEYDGYYYDAASLKNLRFMIDIPLIVNLNFGAASSADTKQLVGGFIGGGIGYHLGPVTKTSIDINGYENSNKTTQSAAGPVLNAGLRVRFGKGDSNYFELRGSFMQSFLKQDAHNYGIQLMFGW